MAVSAIGNTAVYVGLVVPLEPSLGMAGAWATLRRKRDKAVLAAVFVLPLAIPQTTAVDLVVFGR
jgi:ABC-type Fe3+ transport system permease subunit